MKKLCSFALCLFLGGYLLSPDCKAQDWKKIVPLKATCEDLKTYLNVAECKIPVSHYKFANVWVNANLSSGNDEWKVPKGTVTRLSVMFVRWMPWSEFGPVLEYFGTELEEFEIRANGDILDSGIYENRARGIRFTLKTLDADEDGKVEQYVTTLTLDPPRPARNKKQ